MLHPSVPREYPYGLWGQLWNLLGVIQTFFLCPKSSAGVRIPSKNLIPLCWNGFWFAGHGMLAHSSRETIPFPTCKELGLFSSQKSEELLDSARWQQLPKANFPASKPDPAWHSPQGALAVQGTKDPVTELKSRDLPSTPAWIGLFAAFPEGFPGGETLQGSKPC